MSSRSKAGCGEGGGGLSALLDRVRRGATVVIEDRGVPVARIEPIVQGAAPEGRAARLDRQGLIRPARRPLSRDWLGRRPPRLLKGHRASVIILAERREDR